ncbi:MAG: GNAT family N-acetyltransferase [Candidatus Micrarchaeia archaeon]
MEQIVIRKARNKDLKEITHYFRELYKGDEEQEFYKSNLSLHMHKSGQIVFVALSGKKLIGYVWAVYYEHIKNKGVTYIEELFVSEKYRKRKVGTQLINKVISILKQRNIRSVYVAVGSHMYTVQRFYKEIGFINSPEKWFFLSI